MLSASGKYLETFGAPATYHAVIRHRPVICFADQTDIQEISTLISWHTREDLLVMRTNVSSAEDGAVSKGAGVGLLPAYAFALRSKLVPLEIDLRRPFDIWLSTGQQPDTAYPPSDRVDRRVV
jgi:hypothetical protein